MSFQSPRLVKIKELSDKLSSFFHVSCSSSEEETIALVRFWRGRFSTAHKCMAHFPDNRTQGITAMLAVNL